MATLIVPPLDAEPWPTLGPQMCAWMEAHGCYGPGELAGEPYVVSPDWRAWLYRAYEVYPAGHPMAGRRRFKRCYDEQRKGTAKTEKAMLVAFAESHPDAPVRCDGFDGAGQPVGVGVRSPYIPLVSYTVEQTEDLGYNVLRFIIENSDLAGDYDVGLERILLLDRRGREAGKITAVAAAPNSRDGARTTHQHFDEPHRMTLPRLIKAHSTMVENTYKRVGADAWTNYTSTAGDINEESVARDMRQYAQKVDAGEVDDPRLWFFSRFAPNDMPMETVDEVRAFLLEASGPAASWSGDIDGLVARWFEPKTDKQYFRRVWGNQWVAGGDKAFRAERWDELAGAGPVDGELVTLGFAGSRFGRAGLVASSVAGGRVTLVAAFEAPANGTIPEADVTAAMIAAFERFQVWRLYVNPPPWEAAVDEWRGLFGERRVIDWPINRPRQMAAACRLFRKAIDDGDLGHDGNEDLSAHVEACIKHTEPYEEPNDQGELVPVWTIRAPDAEHPIVLAVAAVLSWEARGDAVAAGAQPEEAGELITF